MARSKVAPAAPALSGEYSLKTLIENRTIYNLEHCEMNLFETYQKSDKVALKFNDLVVTSMLRGKKVMHLFGDPGFDYLPGESVIVPANVEMKIDFPEAQMEKPTQCLALAIDNRKIEATLQLLNEKYPRDGRDNYWQLDDRNFFFYNNQEMAQTLNKLVRICQSTSITKDVMADLALQELLITITQSQTMKALEGSESAAKSTVISELTRLIRSNISGKIDLKLLARTACLSTTSLYRMFKRELGVSPMEFIILERIKLAKRLLKNQDIYIKHVSYEAGFDDCNYFIRIFKHYEGITPKQYQQLNS
ncbi:AraC family transcriptional regulator [Rurimicrobium arvi]|uniref:AraC family transcriptional regulator n=1 Tax=Rurimicrobium arvi TaxID=2049916 RepID=A0ABP8MHN0_9BACT